MNLHIFIDHYTNGYNIEFIDFVSFIAILSGIFVIISKNPIVSVLFLINLFLCISSYLLLIGISFIGLSYLLVYIGAISILFLFILMLINIRISELQAETSNSLPLAVIIGICFYLILYQALPIKYTNIFNNELFYNYINYGDKNEENITYVTSNFWDSSLLEISHISSLGNIMYTDYFLWLIITSIILLLAMVGCIIITIRP